MWSKGCDPTLRMLDGNIEPYRKYNCDIFALVLPNIQAHLELITKKSFDPLTDRPTHIDHGQ